MLPDQFPYSLNVLDGVVVDIQPPTYTTCWPDTLNFLTIEQCVEPQVFTVVNMYTDLAHRGGRAVRRHLGGAMWDGDTPRCLRAAARRELQSSALAAVCRRTEPRQAFRHPARGARQTSACAVVRLNYRIGQQT
jgi:hypothetical protein